MATCSDTRRLPVLEALYIKELNPSINIQANDLQALPSVRRLLTQEVGGTENIYSRVWEILLGFLGDDGRAGVGFCRVKEADMLLGCGGMRSSSGGAEKVMVMVRLWVLSTTPCDSMMSQPR